MVKQDASENVSPSVPNATSMVSATQGSDDQIIDVAVPDAGINNCDGTSTMKIAVDVSPSQLTKLHPGVGASTSPGASGESLGADDEAPDGVDSGAKSALEPATDKENNPKILALRTKEDFEFKVSTVKWFGGLCAIAIIGMIVLGFWYLDRIVEASQAYKSEMNFSEVLSASPVNNDTVLLGLEHDGLGMRNKRGISALYMRAYTQFLALIAGTVLSLLGAVFVLARVDTMSTTSNATWGGLKWVLSSSSPGVIVSIVGAILIGGVVYLASDPVQVFDGPVFLGRMSSTAPMNETFNSPSFKTSMSESLKQLRK
jgi:hypothetical protein